MVYIIKFQHPGLQHTLNPTERRNNIKDWNTDAHKRKFLIAEGQYVLCDDTLSDRQKLLFWGEWEPMSFIVRKYKQRPLFPNYLHSPFLNVDKSGKVVHTIYGAKRIANPSSCGGAKVCSSFQNTDPFVFGESFFYSCCRQPHSVKLRNLSPGDIILFGSAILSQKNGGPFFVLDTVFVVGDSRDYTPGTYAADLSGFIPKYYDQIMGYNTWSDKTQQYRCYKGASLNQPVNGMFSFVPCQTEESIHNGFSRVKLTTSDINEITNGLSRTHKISNSNPTNNKAAWDKICEIVRNQGCQLGLNFEYAIQIPPLKINSL